jgi:hypothetical protein
VTQTNLPPANPGRFTGSVWIKAGDETHQIIGTLDKIRDALDPIIPASLGWEVITPAENNDGFLVSVLAKPVNGWRDCEHDPTPMRYRCALRPNRGAILNADRGSILDADWQGERLQGTAKLRGKSPPKLLEALQRVDFRMRRFAALSGSPQRGRASQNFASFSKRSATLARELRHETPP